MPNEPLSIPGGDVRKSQPPGEGQEFTEDRKKHNPFSEQEKYGEHAQHRMPQNRQEEHGNRVQPDASDTNSRD